MNIDSPNPPTTGDSASKDWQKHFTYTVTNVAEHSASGNIDIAITVKYDGTEDIELTNILYLITYTITDQNGKLVALHKKPPILLVNKRGDIDEASDFDFMIASIKKNGAEVASIHNEVNTLRSIIKKHDSFVYTLHIAPQLKQKDDNNNLSNCQLKCCFSLAPINIEKYEPLTNLCTTFKINLK